MADIIIIALLGVAVSFILRRGLHKLRSGQCAGGCSGCGGACSSCGMGNSCGTGRCREAKGKDN